MKRTLLQIFLLTNFMMIAQKPALQSFETSAGKLTIQPLMHSSMVITWNKQVIYVDPYGGAQWYEGQAQANIVLITDLHPDHLDTETLNLLDLNQAKIYAPQTVVDLLPEHLKSKATVINNKELKEISGIKIQAIAMYNLPEMPDDMHPKGRGNGYVIEIGGKRLYISGDTEDTAEMRALKNIDIAFVCMNLPYTMEVTQAASAVLVFKPKVVFPFHYRGKEGFSDVDLFKKLVNEKNPKIDVRLLNWYSTN